MNRKARGKKLKKTLYHVMHTVTTEIEMWFKKMRLSITPKQKKKMKKNQLSATRNISRMLYAVVFYHRSHINWVRKSSQLFPFQFVVETIAKWWWCIVAYIDLEHRFVRSHLMYNKCAAAWRWHYGGFGHLWWLIWIFLGPIVVWIVDAFCFFVLVNLKAIKCTR